MIDSITRITLNLQETNTVVSCRAKRGDTGRKLLIHLSDGSIPYHISDDCYATFTAKKPDGTKINNACTIENNVIIYEFTEQTCTAVGTMKAEIRLYGADDKMITSACFLVNVYDTVFRDGDEVSSESEMNTLDDLILRANAFLNETGKLLRWQGNWNNETEYEANDLVLHQDILYVAEDAAPAGTEPGSEGVAWVPIAGMGTGTGGGADITEQIKQAETAAAAAESSASAAKTSATTAQSAAAAASSSVSIAHSSASQAQRAATQAQSAASSASANSITARSSASSASASASTASAAATRAEEAATRAEEAAANAGDGSGGNATLTADQISALDGMFKISSFTADPTNAYKAFKTAFGIADEEEPDEPVVPDEPEVTLTSISATYSGGDVPVGTAVSDLTGIVVTAMYSDGTSETVTGYTLSGEIAEGSNTVTVSYGGKTTTFTVTGVAESSANLLNSALVTYENTDHNYYGGQRITDKESYTTYVVPIEAGTYRLTVYTVSSYGNEFIGGNHQIKSLADLTPVEDTGNNIQNCYGVNTGDYNSLVRNSYINVGTVQPVSTGPRNTVKQDDGTYAVSVDITYDTAGWVLVTTQTVNATGWAFEKVVA